MIMMVPSKMYWVNMRTFIGLTKNKDVTSKSVAAYMGALSKLTGISNNVSQFLMGEVRYQDGED